MHKHLASNLDYIRKLYAPQDTLLESIDAALHAIGNPIHIGAEEGKLLQMLVGLHGAKNIVEIGTLAGYSTLWMARALPEDGHITTIDKDPKHCALARRFFEQSEVASLITLVEGNALEVLQTLTPPQKNLSSSGLTRGSIETNTSSAHGAVMDTPVKPEYDKGAGFDMVFIDADKINYCNYLDWAEKNIRQGGMIVADNTLLFGAAAQDSPPDDIAPTTWKNMREFNERLSDGTKYYATMIPTEEGMSVAIKLF